MKSNFITFTEKTNKDVHVHVSSIAAIRTDGDKTCTLILTSGNTLILSQPASAVLEMIRNVE